MTAPKDTHIAPAIVRAGQFYTVALCGRTVRPVSVRAEEEATCMDCILAATFADVSASEVTR